jgi:hypothetical protein
MNAQSESLGDQVSRLQKRVNELRRAGDPGALLAGARAAADEIEGRVEEPWDVSGREAMTVVRRFTFNAAADCWPGWAAADKPPDPRNLRLAQELALRSAQIVEKLRLAAVQEGTGIWLCGAFDLALGQYAEASSAFAVARARFVTAGTPGLILLTEGYSAIVRQISGVPTQADSRSLDQVLSDIDSGGFEDGPEWIAQLQTALQVFA